MPFGGTITLGTDTSRVAGVEGGVGVGIGVGVGVGVPGPPPTRLFPPPHPTNTSVLRTRTTRVTAHSKERDRVWGEGLTILYSLTGPEALILVPFCLSP